MTEGVTGGGMGSFVQGRGDSVRGLWGCECSQQINLALP